MAADYPTTYLKVTNAFEHCGCHFHEGIRRYVGREDFCFDESDEQSMDIVHTFRSEVRYRQSDEREAFPGEVWQSIEHDNNELEEINVDVEEASPEPAPEATPQPNSPFCASPSPFTYFSQGCQRAESTPRDDQSPRYTPESPRYAPVSPRFSPNHHFASAPGHDQEATPEPNSPVYLPISPTYGPSPDPPIFGLLDPSTYATYKRSPSYRPTSPMPDAERARLPKLEEWYGKDLWERQMEACAERARARRL